MGASKHIGKNLDNTNIYKQFDNISKNNGSRLKEQKKEIRVVKRTQKSDNNVKYTNTKQKIDESVKLRMLWTKFGSKGAIYKIFRIIDKHTREQLTFPYKFCKLVKIKEQNISKFYVVDVLSTKTDSRHFEEIRAHGAHLHKDNNVMISVNGGDVELHCEVYSSVKNNPKLFFNKKFPNTPKKKFINKKPYGNK